MLINYNRNIHSEIDGGHTSPIAAYNELNDSILVLDVWSANSSWLWISLEDLYKSVEQIETRIEDMMHNKVNIQFLQKNQEKVLEDLEALKDKVRANGNGTH